MKHPPKINHVDEITDEFTNGPDEARRQMNNFHKYIFSPKVKDDEWSQKDLSAKPYYYDHRQQNTTQRDIHYKQYGLRAPSSLDPHLAPHYTAQYLDHMHHHFPDIADNMNMKPMSKGSGQEAAEQENFELNKKSHSFIRAIQSKYAKRMTDDALNFLNKIGAHKMSNSIIDRINRKNDEKLRQSIPDLDRAQDILSHSFEKEDFEKVRKWHSENTDFHHLTADQAYESFADDHSKAHITYLPMNKKRFTKNWNKLNNINEHQTRTFRNFVEMLVESLDFVKAKYNNISTDHDQLAQHHNSNDIIDHLANNFDPTPSKKYTEWLTREYSKGHFRQEDGPRTKQLLVTFQNHHKDVGSKNILDHDYPTVLNKLESKLPKTGKSKKEEKRIAKSTGADTIHNDHEYSIISPKNKEAACLYGANTKWCTAASENNRFDDYNEKGPLYIFHDKKSNRKYQFHFESNQFMDEKDQPIDTYDLSKKHPLLQKYFGHHIRFNPNATSEHIDKALDDDKVSVRRDAIRHPNATSKHIDKALNDRHEYVRWDAISHPDATSEHIDKALNDRDNLVRRHAIEHPNATSEHIDKALNDRDNLVRRHAIEHPNATSKHIDKALNDTDSLVRLSAISHPNATSEHIDKALNDAASSVRSKAIRHPNATSKHIDKALNDTDEYVRVDAISHPDATPEHIDKALNDRHVYVRRTAIEHPNATSEHIDKALNDSYEPVRRTAIEHPNATSENIHKALNDTDEYVRGDAISHPNSTSKHIDKALNDRDDLVRRLAISHRDATPEHIDKALNDRDNRVRHIAIQHPNTTSENIHKALNDEDSFVRNIAQIKKENMK